VSEAGGSDRYRAYREAIRRRVCSVCLDSADDSSCSLAGSRTCAIDEHLSRLVDTILEVRATHDDAYAAAVETRVCSHCRERDSLGRCRLRRDGSCALAVYLPLIVEAIVNVRSGDARPEP
jgi:hypothetical protein